MQSLGDPLSGSSEFHRNSNHQAPYWSNLLMIGALDFSGCWSLDFGIYLSLHERRASVSTVRLAARHSHFSHDRLALRACGDRAAHKVAATREDYYRRPLRGADVELRHLFNLYPQPRRYGLAANFADANVRLGHGRSDRGDVDRKSALVRSGILLGHRRHVASRPHAKPALWLSRLAVHQFFYLALRHHRGRRFPDADPAIPALSHVDRARVVVVGVLFCGDAYRR